MTKTSKIHLLCYIRRDRLASWKLDSFGEDENAIRPALSYGSNARIFELFAKKGNVLWVIGANPNGQPSLEARIQISEIEKDEQQISGIHNDNDWKLKVKGTHGSAFFGLNDASQTLMRLVFKNNRSLWSLRTKYSSNKWKTIFGRNFQSPRVIAPTGVIAKHHRSWGSLPLEQLAKQAISRSLFLSWKHCDSNRQRLHFMKAFTIKLCSYGFAVWWDRTALTNFDEIDDFPAINKGSAPHFSHRKKDERLRRLLRQGLAQSSILALWTDKYGHASESGASNWTREEWENARGSRIALVLGHHFQGWPDMKSPDRIICIPKNPEVWDAAPIAQQFKHAYESLSVATSFSGNSQ